MVESLTSSIVAFSSRQTFLFQMFLLPWYDQISCQEWEVGSSGKEFREFEESVGGLASVVV